MANAGSGGGGFGQEPGEGGAGSVGNPRGSASGRGTGRAGGVGTPNVGGGFSSKSKNRSRAEKSQGPLASLGLSRAQAAALAALPGMGITALPGVAHGLAKAIGPAIQAAFEGALGLKGSAPAIDTSFTDVTDETGQTRGDNNRSGGNNSKRFRRSSILAGGIKDKLGTVRKAPSVTDAAKKIEATTEEDSAAKKLRLSEARRRGARSAVLSDVSSEKALSASVNRPVGRSAKILFGS